jgi:hypothetical protein
VLETHERRQAVLKANALAKAAYTNAIEYLRSLTGSERMQISLHPWQSSRWTVKDAFEPREPHKYAIQGLIRKPSVSIFYGRPGGFKTLLAISAAATVATGNQKW